MEDPKVPFADTTARRAQLMAATERFKDSISDSVQSIKGDATEVGRTAAVVAGAALAVYLVANALLPKSDEYRYAEKHGEPEEHDYDEDELDDEDDDMLDHAPASRKVVKQQAKKTQKQAAATGLIGGLITSVLTNIAREQLMGFLARIRQNNAISPSADPTKYNEKATTQPVSYSTPA